MFQKIFKIIFLSGKSYLLFIFVATLLSLFSYILSSNIAYSVNDYLKSQIQPLLGGDIVFSSDSDVIDTSPLQDFTIAKTIETNTTLFDREKNPYLIELVYHDENYPIYDTFSYDVLNASGSLIVSKEIYDTFGSDIEIFEKSYQVYGVITKTPLGNLSVFSNFEKIYLPLSFFDERLSSDNSRLQYKEYLKFPGDYDSQRAASIKEQFRDQDGVRVRTLDDRNDTIGDITDRLYLFINFFNLLIFILTFFIVILSLETFYKKLKNTIGLLSILGLKKSRLFFYNLALLMLLFTVAFVIASLANIVIIELIQSRYDFFQVYQYSFYKGIAISIILLGVGLYSPFYKVYTSDIRGLLSDSSFFSNFVLKDYLIYLTLILGGFFSISLISGISFLYSLFYSFAFILGVVVLYIFFAFLLKILFAFLSRFIDKTRNFYTYDALRSTIKPGNVSFLIIFSSFISFVSIFLFSVFSGSFVSFLRDLTVNSSDTFVINISKDYADTTRKFFQDEEIYEVVPLRIDSINGATLSEHLDMPKVSGEFTREFFSLVRPLDQLILKGEPLNSGGVSVDEELAQRLSIEIGDKIVYRSAGLEKELTVQNLRKAERNGANPFFYFSLYPEDFERFPKNYFVSYNSSEKSPDIQFNYSQATQGTVSFIDAKEIIAIVLDIASKILLIIYFCLGYIFIFSFLTFIVSISFLRTFKTQKLSLLHILGGKKKSLLRGVFLEYSYLIVLGLIVSLTAGSIILFLIAYFIDFFTVDTFSYIGAILLLLGLMSVMLVYLKFSKKNI